jgi:hypothetical protein
VADVGRLVVVDERQSLPLSDHRDRGQGPAGVAVARQVGEVRDLHRVRAYLLRLLLRLGTVARLLAVLLAAPRVLVLPPVAVGHALGRVLPLLARLPGDARLAAPLGLGLLVDVDAQVGHHVVVGVVLVLVRARYPDAVALADRRAPRRVRDLGLVVLGQRHVVVDHV